MYEYHQASTALLDQIVEANKKGQKVESLEAFAVEHTPKEQETYNNVVGQDSLTRFDQPKRKRSRKKNRGARNRRKNQRKNA